MDTEQAIQWSVGLVSLASAVSSAEFLAVALRYSDNGILSWRIAQHQSNIWRLPRLSLIVDHLFGPRGFRIILSVRLLASCGSIVLAFTGCVSSALLCVIWLTTILISIRSPFGLDGAHQMVIIILSALILATAMPSAPLVANACLWFITIQLSLSYFIAGIAKLSDPVWQTGIALRGIFSTAIYGHQFVYRILRKSATLGLFCCWATIVFECSFPLVFLLDFRHAQWLIVTAISFHLFNAIFMGLNSFMYSFVAAYPALIWSVSP